MSAHYVVHVTDLHLVDPKNPESTEFLRDFRYPAYLRALATEILARTWRSKNVYLVVTGDFVDEGSVHNFAHAKKVIEFFRTELHLPARHVALCVGNHDIVRAHEIAGNVGEARAEYLALATGYANGEPLVANECASLLSLDKRVFVLALDATYGAKGEDRPGDLDARRTEEVVRWLAEHVSDKHLLIVASHYPVENSAADLGSYDGEAATHSMRHVFNAAAPLRDRITDLRRKGQTLWVCGDIHRDMLLNRNDIFYLTTGRIGGAPRHEPATPIRRQATLMQLEFGKAPSATRFEWTPRSHSPLQEPGEWRGSELRWTVMIEPTYRQPETSLRKLTTPRSAPLAPTTSGRSGKGSRRSHGGVAVAPEVERISAELEGEVMAAIEDHRLYQFGRFTGSVGEASLSWISIGPLLNEGGMFSSVVEATSSWLESVIAKHDPDWRQTTVLVGADCWGAIISSQLSAILDICSFSVPARGSGRHSVPQERITDTIVPRLKSAVNMVLICDVVASGRSLAYLKQSIETHIGAGDRRWLAVSLICDPTRLLPEHVGFLIHHGTVCASLRMPSMSLSSLPSEEILPSTLSFI